MKTERREVDYSKWLGPDYKKAPKPRRCATYVSNHCGVVDGFSLPWALNGDMAFSAGAFVRNIPIFKDILIASEGLFVPRSGEAEVKQRFVDGMIKR